MSNLANARPAIRGVVFDLDGTLVIERIDFAAIRRDMGLPEGAGILEAMDGMSKSDRIAAEEILHRHERLAANSAILMPGVRELIDRIDGLGLPRAVLTRNSRASAEQTMAGAGLTGFFPLIAREDAPSKPDPAGIHQIAAAWQIEVTQLLMIGDYVFDVRAGRAAGSRTALITHGRDWPFASEADWVFPDFHSIPEELLRWLGS